MVKKKNTKEMSKLKPDYSLASVVSDRVQIENVRLISCECYQTPEASIGPKSLDIDCNVTAEADKKKGFVLVFPDFKLKGYRLNDEKKNPVIVIDAKFVLIYKADSLEGLKQENFEAFGNTNGLYNAWPYWREFVQNTVARMGLPPLTVPVFRLVKPKEAKKAVRKRTRKSAANQ